MRRISYDANPDSETFGALLATLTIPDAGAAHHAQFGASVGSADTNLLIGAPGKNGDTGEVDVFQGDPSQPLFGNLLLVVPNPNCAARLTFRLVRLGNGNQPDCRERPSTTPRARPPAACSSSTAPPARSITAIANPRPAAATGFGSAVASVGPNVLIGSPLDDTAGPGAGAAFLYSAVGRAPSDVRPARRRRRPLRRVGRRHGHDGLDRCACRNPWDIGRRCRLPLRRRPGKPDVRTADRRRARAHAHVGRRLRSVSRVRRRSDRGRRGRRDGRARPGPKPSIFTSPAPRFRFPRARPTRRPRLTIR